MTYLEMVKAAKKNGTFAEKQMWDSVESVSELLDDIKDSHPERYWQFLREQAGIMNGSHYNEEYALYDVKNMQPLGEYWSIKQVEEATKGMTFPSGTTLYDRYVAFNAFANDLKGVLTDEEILKAAHAFWFADKDYKGKNKIWCYMAMVHGL